VWSLAANGLLSVDDVPRDFPLYDALAETGPSAIRSGGSAIAAPDGSWVVEPLVDEERLVVAMPISARCGRPGRRWTPPATTAVPTCSTSVSTGAAAKRHISRSSAMHLETRAVHAGTEVDPHSGAVVEPITLSATFERDPDGGHRRGYHYSKAGNPNLRSLERAVAALEAARRRSRTPRARPRSRPFSARLAQLDTC